MLILKMLSTSSLTKISLKVSEARDSRNGNFKILFHIKSIKLNHINISYRKTLCEKILKTCLHQ